MCRVYEDSKAHSFCVTYKVPFELITDATPTPTVAPTPTPAPTPTIAPTSIVSIDDCCVDWIEDQTYTGRHIEPEVYVSYGGVWLVEGRDYTVSYSNNRSIGKAKATITGLGNYTGRASVSFKIVPRGTSISRLSKGSKRFTVRWKKRATHVTGYQIQYSTSPDFETAKTKRIKSYRTTSTTIKSLRKRTTYYVRVRTYKTVDGTYYYSEWSDVKSVKTK